MSRRNRPEKREIIPDIRFNSALVAEFIAKLMTSGKKSTAQRIMYDAIDLVETRSKRPGLDMFEQALRNAGPAVEVKPRRVGGATYQVPVEVAPDRQVSLAIRWLIASARKRPGKSMSERLAGELLDAANNQGATVKKREDTHKMAEANRAFAHYRW
ncbi:MAG TPA: 30S ribosomal protein S7 [Anaerolineae bacterium]|nr:30S ribosomal protein S7 [Anaerolineae bacterium]